MKVTIKKARKCSGQFGTFSDACQIFAWNLVGVQTPKTSHSLSTAEHRRYLQTRDPEANGLHRIRVHVRRYRSSEKTY